MTEIANLLPLSLIRKTRQYLLCSFIVFSLTVGTAVQPLAALAQFAPLPAPDASALPTGVERRGTLESTPVTLDGEDLFRIAALAVPNRSEPGERMPVEVRARQIEGNLQRLLPGNRSSGPDLDPENLNVMVETVNNFPVLFAEDVALTQPRALLTVTDADAEYHAISKEELADQWQDIVEQALRQALALRQPEAVRQQLTTFIRVLTGTIIATLLLGFIWVLLGRRERVLRQRRRAESALTYAHKDRPDLSSEVDATETDETAQRALALRRYFGLERRLYAVRFVRWLLFWIIAFTWAFGTAYSLSLFPQTRHLARKLIIAPLVLLLVWFLIGLVDRLIDFSVEKFVQKLAESQSYTTSNLQRVNTIARVIKGFKMVLVYTIGILWALQWLQLIPGSVIALGTVIALVFSFAAQNLVRDLVNGFLILLEDQYRIGDVVNIGDKGGLVENFNLRITQLRNPDGNLITLPNSSIVEVENLSRDWARSDFRIEVAYDTDVDLALAIVRDTAEHLAKDPKWQPSILDTTEFLGVDHLSHNGIVIRIWLKTAPIKQWVVAMELRRRLKKTFDQHGIQIGTPQQVWLQNSNGKADAMNL
jgi:small conductance mechanosensitive channel